MTRPLRPGPRHRGPGQTIGGEVFKRLFAWLNKCEICGTPYCHDRTCDELKLDLRAW